MTRGAADLLAVDGGGSKVDAALLRRTGEVLAAVRFTGRTRDGEPDGGYFRMVAGAIERLRAERGGGDGPLARLGVFCMAGADLPADDRRIAAWIRREGWAEDRVIRNDSFAILRAGTERTWGVAVVCGYGTNCAGVSPTGRMYRLPAVGPISGDWGGGRALGGEALFHAIRAEDGRGRRTALRASVPAHFGMRRPRQVMEALYFERLAEDRLVELAPLVFRAAADGDEVARSIVDRQADEIACMAGTAIRRLRMRDLDVDVVLGGGIFRNRFRPFFDRIEADLRAVAPAVRIGVLDAPPVVGSALLGLDALGATRAAQARARRDLTHERMRAETAV